MMALKPRRTERARTVGHISHDARVRVDQRVKEILARREAAAPHDPSSVVSPLRVANSRPIIVET
jgi:hypothetical protein